MPPLTFIEVCAGAGGMSTGLMRAGWTPLLLNDLDRDCCETLTRNHTGVPVVRGRMEELDLTAHAGRVDLLAGGIPCQSFSQSGRRRGLDDPRGGLMFRFIDLVRDLRPRAFLIENVKGLLTHNQGRTLETVLEALHRAGAYAIVHRCLDASHYHVPQKRERVFIVGIRSDTGRPFAFPAPTLTPRTLRDVLVDVPPSDGATYPPQKRALFHRIPPGGCWIHLPEDEQRAYLGKSFFSGGGRRGILHRLSMDRPSLTLLCTPSQKQTERCHPVEDRPLTIREYARIQTFDDAYEFMGGLTSRYRQIGNAVPVEMAYRMGIALREALA